MSECKKVSFETQKEVRSRCKEINSENGKHGTKLRYYKCRKCNKWHLSSMSKHQHKFYTDKQYRQEVKRESFLKRESEYWLHKLGIK